MAWKALAVVGLLAGAAQLTVLPPTARGVVYLSLGVSSILAMVVGIRRHRPEAAGAWYVLTAGVAVFLAGDAVFYFDKLVRHVDRLFPSLADAFFLASYPLIITGLLLLIRQGHPGPDRTSLIDACIIATSMGLVAQVYLIAPSMSGVSIYLLGGLAALHPSMGLRAGASAERGERSGRRRLAVVGAVVLVAPAVLAVEAARGRYDDLEFIAAATFALSVLVLARMSRVLSSLGDIAASERTLRSAAAGLAGATDRPAICAAAIQAVRQLVGDSGPTTHLAMWSRGDLVAASGPGGADAGGADAGRAPAPHGLAPITLVQLDALLNDPAADHNGGTRYTEVLPVLVVDELVGSFVVISDKPIPRALCQTVESLTTQLSLALERLVLSDDLHQRRGEARFRSLVHNSSDVITVVDADSTIRYQTPSIRQVLGYTTEQLTGTLLMDLIHPNDVPLALTLFGEAAAIAGSIGPVALRARRADGTWVDAEAIGDNLLGDPNVHGIVVTLRDVSVRKELERTLTHQAFHDSLTGLANRALFIDRVEHAVRRRGRTAHEVAVLFLDLDDFKTVNDSLGHAAGDKLLESVAHRLDACLRPADTTARLGGDEFAVLLEGMASSRDTFATAQRLLDSLRKPFALESKAVDIHASVGIAFADDDDLGSEELLRNADIAMYMAKGRGKGGYEVFESRMLDAAIHRLDLRADLQRAVDSDGFVLHYQPIVSLDSGRVVGFEALVRWQHPTRGIIGPTDFIPLAEETDLILPLGHWVLEQACLQARSWYSLHGTTMSINLSQKQLAQPGLEAEVGEILSRTGVAPSAITLEITESVVMHDVDRRAAVLARLRRLGVRVAIDDFGTGYSSLAALRQLPIDVLKIDKSFVDSVRGSSEDTVLVAMVIDLARGLGLVTVAEASRRSTSTNGFANWAAPWARATTSPDLCRHQRRSLSWATPGVGRRRARRRSGSSAAG